MENLIINERQCDHYFDGIVQVSQSCGWDVLRNYILERQNLDIQGLLGSCLYVDLITNILSEKYEDLLNGSTYEGCGGALKMHSGLRRVLAHYSYASYIYRKSFVDVPFGVVIKQSEDSVPVGTKELRNLHDEHRDIAYRYWKQVEEYLCANRESIPLWSKKSKGCSCSCVDDCAPKGTEPNAKTRIKVIRL